ncbi:Wadjet anti-phage system protein JetD domain-containing protein [Ramlibacter sp. WS9]|uniref:Wadjet anti-phage system protein JetD domain-containing protein n=1 Tax=Ramlibacter sp. WS9 TaxID=1882741 RepID=UPI00114470CF|nr:Wadjet anti-phage system protein JetD domain-containing protein [Ramlibacter sp. WS9]ROZ63643.1 hypothetical protein EEB15_29575 [Ramlibacter sp. WS9]
MSAAWTHPVDLRAQVLRLWDQGRLLACLVDEGSTQFPLRMALRCPDSADCTSRFDEVRAWSQGLQQGAMEGYRLAIREWKHPVLGRNALPQQAWIDSLDDALRLAGKASEARRFATLLAATRKRQPVLVPWLARRPLQALALSQEWTRLLDVVAWLQACPRPGIYLRQVDVAGVDSKFIEQHRAVLAELLDLALPAQAFDAGAAGLANFARRYGFRDKPVRIRFRLLDPRRSLLGTGGGEDITLDADSFAQLRPGASRVFITENEINFLAFPAALDSLVIFGAGYGLETLADIPWLHDKEVHYWGDIDTHGFAILDELRSGLPHARSFLMDRQTLMTHEAHWTDEQRPAVRELEHLAADERTLYDDLRRQRLIPRQLRLEQERVGFGHLLTALATLG